MKAKTGAAASGSVLDPSCPWELPRLKWEFSKYPYRMTAAEWKGLCARAEQGDAAAQAEVAARYDDGCKNRSGKILVRRSARKALEWYRRSADLGFAPAQNTLGVLLGGVKATEASRHEALKWLKKAFRGGDSCAANNLAITYRENGDLSRAVFWFKKGIKASRDDGACVELGIHYYWGRGVRTDHVEAVRYFRKAIKGKNISEAERDDAFFYLGIAHLEGKGVRTSPRTGRKLLERANIDHDHPGANHLLNQLTKSSFERKET